MNRNNLRISPRGDVSYYWQGHGYIFSRWRGTTVLQVIKSLISFFQELWALAKRHRILTSVLVVLSLVFTGFSAYIGFVFMAVLLLPVALLAWWLIQIVQKRKAYVGTAEAINVVASIALASVAVFALIQLIPYGKSHSNPPITGEPKWANNATRDLMVRACFGCHSNEVEYPSYSNVAPISWAVQNHIDGGRSRVNYSEFATSPRGARNTLAVIKSGWMPASYYTRFGKHPEAKLTADELALLIRGIAATDGLHR